MKTAMIVRISSNYMIKCLMIKCLLAVIKNKSQTGSHTIHKTIHIISPNKIYEVEQGFLLPPWD